MENLDKLMDVLNDEALAKSLEGMSEEDAVKALKEKGVDISEYDDMLEDAPEAELSPEQMDKVAGGTKIYCRFCCCTFRNAVTYWLHIRWSSACMAAVYSNKKMQGIK